MVKNRKKIVILGGGFAGVECARKLEKYFVNDIEIEIVLVSEDNFLLFTPMLPQVASGMIETRHIIMPIRTICEKTKFYEGRSCDLRTKNFICFRGIFFVQYYDNILLAKKGIY